MLQEALVALPHNPNIFVTACVVVPLLFKVINNSEDNLLDIASLALESVSMHINKSNIESFPVRYVSDLLKILDKNKKNAKLSSQFFSVLAKLSLGSKHRLEMTSTPNFFCILQSKLKGVPSPEKRNLMFQFHKATRRKSLIILRNLVKDNQLLKNNPSFFGFIPLLKELYNMRVEDSLLEPTLDYLLRIHFNDLLSKIELENESENQLSLLKKSVVDEKDRIILGSCEFVVQILHSKIQGSSVPKIEEALIILSNLSFSKCNQKEIGSMTQLLKDLQTIAENGSSAVAASEAKKILDNIGCPREMDEQVVLGNL